MTLLALTGRARSGKTTAAEWLESRYGATVLGFADPVREACRTLAGMSADEWERAPRDEKLPRLGVSPRDLMERLGAALRTANPDAFLNVTNWRVLEARRASWGAAEPDPLIVIADVRTARELSWVRAQAASVVHLRNPRLAPPPEGNATEAEHDPLPGEWVIDNGGTLAQLRQQLDYVMEEVDRACRAAG